MLKVGPTWSCDSLSSAIFLSSKEERKDRRTGDVHPGSRADPPEANRLNGEGSGCFKRGGSAGNWQQSNESTKQREVVLQLGLLRLWHAGRKIKNASLTDSRFGSTDRHLVQICFCFFPMCGSIFISILFFSDLFLLCILLCRLLCNIGRCWRSPLKHCSECHAHYTNCNNWNIWRVWYCRGDLQMPLITASNYAREEANLDQHVLFF